MDVPFALPETVVAAIHELAEELAIPPRSWPLTAFRLMLPRFTNAPDPVGERTTVAEALLTESTVDERGPVLRVRDDLAGRLHVPGWTRSRADQFADALAAACAELTHPGRTVGSIRGISRRGAESLRRLNNSARPYPKTSIESLVLAQLHTRPSAIAVRDSAAQLSYRELARAAAGMAGALRRAGVRPGDVVGIAVLRGTDEAVAVLATLWAGASYTSVDEQVPDHRLTQVLELARPAAVICDEAGARRLSGAGLRMIAARQPAADTGEPLESPDPDRVAFLAFTSGSTGTPKGVAVRHRGIVRLVYDVPTMNFGPRTRMLRLSPLNFDPSSMELWGPLCNGGRIEAYPPGLPSPAQLGRFLVEREITALWLTAGFFRLMADFAARSLSTVDRLFTGGEVVSPEHVRTALTANPGLTVINGYGPTESATFATAHAVAHPDDVESPLPIGRMWPNTRGYVLDSRHRLLPPGAVGELYLGGDGLAAGYHGEAEQTSRCFGRFSPDVEERLYRTGDLVMVDSSGRLRFLGRCDDQVKLSGVRVEPEEIRQVLRAHPRVRDAVVVAAGAAPDRYLVAGYTAQEGFPVPTARELAEFTAARLPRYMVPARWAPVPDFPLTSNGKVDHAALGTLARLPSDR